MDKRDLARGRGPSRRDVLKVGLATALGSQLAMLDGLVQLPVRMAMAAGGALPDIQFDIGNFIAPGFTVNNVMVRFGPVFTFFTPARLTRTPNARDQAVFSQALATIESVFPFSPKGVFTFVSYGVPYFNRLPAAVVAGHMPAVASNGAPVLQEAVPSPTDVSPANPGITKQKFNVPVAIEHNDMLFTLRSDSTQNLRSIMGWLQGSNSLGGRRIASPAFGGLFRFQRTRVMFQAIGLPRQVANANHLPYAGQINPQSPMWMGFADQQDGTAAPTAALVTFAGSAGQGLSTAKAGDYFDNGSIQHLSHDILDLAQFYLLPAQDPAGEGEPFTERVQYMFNSNQLGTADGLPSDGNADQFTNGGGPAFLNNVFQGADAALRSARDSAGTFGPGNATLDATFQGQHRLGHNAALQRSSRLPDGTPLHIRMDGTGFDNLDVPGGGNQPKLEFTVFVPSANFFQVMRQNQAAQDLQAEFGVDPADNGLERFITATRRQNFLVPPRRTRAFPLLEMTWSGRSVAVNGNGTGSASAPTSGGTSTGSTGGTTRTTTPAPTTRTTTPTTTAPSAPSTPRPTSAPTNNTGSRTGGFGGGFGGFGGFGR